jgi:hypothetical protein
MAMISHIPIQWFDWALGFSLARNNNEWFIFFAAADSGLKV